MCFSGAKCTQCVHACMCVCASTHVCTCVYPHRAGVLMPACPHVVSVCASCQVQTELGEKEELDKVDLKLELTLHLLGLKAAADTMVGSKTVRGVSGGERHRVTTAEMISGEWATPRPSHTCKQ